MPLCVIKTQRMSNRKRHLSAQVPWEQYRCAGISLHPQKPAAKYKKLSIAVLLLIHKPEAHQTQSQCWIMHVGCLPEELSWNGSSNSDAWLLKDNNNLKHYYYVLMHHLVCFFGCKMQFCSTPMASLLVPYQCVLFELQNPQHYVKIFPLALQKGGREGGIHAFWNLKMKTLQKKALRSHYSTGFVKKSWRDKVEARANNFKESALIPGDVGWAQKGEAALGQNEDIRNNGRKVFEQRRHGHG